MHEAFRNGLFDVRGEEAPLGPEAIRLVQGLRERGYAGRTWNMAMFLWLLSTEHREPRGRPR